MIYFPSVNEMVRANLARLDALYRHANTGTLPTYERHRGCDGTLSWVPVYPIRYTGTIRTTNTYALSTTRP